MARTMMLTATLAASAALAGCAMAPTGRGAIVKAAPTCQDITIPIYFEPNEAEVPPEGRRVLMAEAQAVRACRVNGVRVMGLADAVGDPAANLELSKRRAASVAEAVKQAGLPSAQFDVAAAGQADSMSAEGQVRPVRRRADVTLSLSQP
ncbi:MAG: OmpA family protein [Phenylobacterium sp.]|nr:OmpA family protein [Phenylobacterium sp.]